MLHLCYHEHLSMVRCLIRHSLPILEYEVPTDVSLTGACLRSTYETINEYHNAPVALHIIKYLKHRYYTEAVSHIYRSRFANSNAIAIRRLCTLPLYINRVSRSVQDSATSDSGEAINVCVQLSIVIHGNHNQNQLLNALLWCCEYNIILCEKCYLYITYYSTTCRPWWVASRVCSDCQEVVVCIISAFKMIHRSLYVCIYDRSGMLTNYE